MEDLIIWKANTAIRRLVKPEGGIVRIVMGQRMLDALAASHPETYLSELFEIKYDLYNQIGYVKVGANHFGIACSRMVDGGVRNAFYTLRVEDGMLRIEHYESAFDKAPIEGAQWHNVKSDSRRK